MHPFYAEIAKRDELQLITIAEQDHWNKHDAATDP
jgi:hypothetical protein